MKYSIKTEVYNENLPFNKWFDFESMKKEKVRDLMVILGLEEKRIGLIMVNNNPISSNRILEDRDSIRFIGKIYPEYL